MNAYDNYYWLHGQEYDPDDDDWGECSVCEGELLAMDSINGEPGLYCGFCNLWYDLGEVDDVGY